MLKADAELAPRRGFDLESLVATLRVIPDGGLVALTLDGEGEVDLDRWSALTRHPIVERQLLPDGATRLVVRKGAAHAEPPPTQRRLWLYANFDCNLACDYCCVRSSPTAERRALDPGVAGSLAAQAAKRGYDAVYVTGGEPFLRADLDTLVLATAEHLPTTILTNAMLFKGARLALLDKLPRDRVRLQVSLDSPTPEIHDAHRGAGSWARALDGIATARRLGFRVRVAATTTSDTQMREMDTFLAEQGIPPEDRVIRPLARRGFADEGLVVARRDLTPELTLTASGWYWHPVGATDDDLRVAGAEADLDAAQRALGALLAQDQDENDRIRRMFPCA